MRARWHSQLASRSRSRLLGCEQQSFPAVPKSIWTRGGRSMPSLICMQLCQSYWQKSCTHCKRQCWTCVMSTKTSLKSGGRLFFNFGKVPQSLEGMCLLPPAAHACMSRTHISNTHNNLQILHENAQGNDNVIFLLSNKSLSPLHRLHHKLCVLS